MTFECWRQQIYHSRSITKMSLSDSSIRVTLLFSFFIHPWANLFLNKNKGRTRIDWQFKPAYVAASRMANIFSIPPTSTESERVFSGARRTISWDKTRLGSNVVEYSECLKSWVSVLKGKRRPLLAAVFRSAEEVDKACGISATVDTEKEFEEVA